MDQRKDNLCSMFGSFNLRGTYDLTSYKQAYDAFCKHLQEKGYVHSWRMWERAYHEGYDTNYPEAHFVIEMCFHSHQASLDNWAYIETHSEPIRSLHAAVTRQVKETHFVLCREVV